MRYTFPMITDIPHLPSLLGVLAFAVLFVSLMRLGGRIDRVERLDERLDESEERLRSELSLTRQESAAQVQRITDALLARLDSHAGRSDARLGEIRTAVGQTLHETLGKRLDSSFGQVAQRLEGLQRGLQEVNHLSTSVGDLKKILGGVKTRGGWGEVQLSMLLEDMMAASQYEANVAVREGSRERVEFALLLPGDDDGPLRLAIDAKFPVEDFTRLVDARDAGDSDALMDAKRALAKAIKEQGKSISEKYINPPVTVDFAVMYLPSEGLYAEVLSLPGVFEQIQRDLRVIIAGPVTLTALLSSLQVGFKTLAVRESAGEVARLLHEIRGEWEKYTGAVEDVRKKVDETYGKIEALETRTRVMGKKLRDVEKLSSGEEDV